MPSENIFLTRDISGKLKEFLQGKQYSSVCVIADENTEKHCFPLLLPALQKYHLITIPSGEENKTLSTCERIWKGMTDQQLDRKAVVINLGGGVIGDMGGFCASTYKRGIDFIQIPTTLLSQVDASVGGKLGVDFFSYKNHIGVFKEPAAVFINADFLKTLDPAELRSGFAEIIKHCLIADKTKWEEISRKSLAEQNWEDLIAHSVEIKSKVTTADPTEQGLRKILNFGHTIGHAIESYYLTIKDKKLLHGEAIAIGMVAESYIAEKRGFIS
ncbi:MAG TPA: 3-dehydroquinate synthase family protein, partial [Cytophagaceae bacterium]